MIHDRTREHDKVQLCRVHAYTHRWYGHLACLIPAFSHTGKSTYRNDDRWREDFLRHVIEILDCLLGNYIQ